VHVISGETRNVLITGGTKGIGLACAKQLIEKPNWNVYCTSRSKTLVATNLSNYNFQRLDLCDIRSVEKFAVDWGAKPLDVLVLNAGVQHAGLTLDVLVLNADDLLS
jgi:NAD(P)-dependent dehydrogenase (short-subunit alcohol dehydrogenase family)